MSVQESIPMMVFSILALPLFFMVRRMTYAYFRRHVWSLKFLIIGIIGAALTVFKGAIGWLGLCLAMPYVQVLIIAAFAWLYRAFTGADLEERPLTSFSVDGKIALALFDKIAMASMFGMCVGIFFWYDALTYGA